MKEQVVELLNNLNHQFFGDLINSNIEGYVDKLLTYSSLISFQKEGVLNAFIAYYDNDPANRTAYLTMLAVSSDNQGMGIGSILLKASIENLKRKGFSNYKLEVKKQNFKAIKFYESFGFNVLEENGLSLFMIKEL